MKTINLLRLASAGLLFVTLSLGLGATADHIETTFNGDPDVAQIWSTFEGCSSVTIRIVDASTQNTIKEIEFVGSVCYYNGGTSVEDSAVGDTISGHIYWYTEVPEDDYEIWVITDGYAAIYSINAEG